MNDDRMYEEWWDGDVNDINTFVHQDHSHHHAHLPQAADEDEEDVITIGSSDNTISDGSNSGD